MAIILRLLILLLLPLRAEAETPITEAGIRRAIEDYARERHISVESLDPDRAVAEALAHGRVEPDREAYGKWLARRFHMAMFGFAPVGAVHDAGARYRLPFVLQIPRYVTQGVGGEYSHQTPEDYHAFDFVMPIGTPILAARSGRVARVVDGFREGGADRALSHKANMVVVLHDDGTFALYVHLEEGIGIREGAVVKQGQRLGRSGYTGYGVGPHLHFVVRRISDPLTAESVPILFGVGSKDGFVPVKNEWYGSLPKSTVELEIRVNGELIDPMSEQPVKRGDTLRLGVTKVGRTGRRSDVTSHPLTRYVPMTPWSVDVTGKARVSVTPAEGFAHQEEIDRSRGTVAIMHGKPRTGMGIVAVNVVIAD